MVRWSPFDVPFEDLNESHLQELVQRNVEEGLFLEYKSEFNSEKVARAVASFANDEGGGWLVVGMRADKLSPVELQGVSSFADIEERLVTSVRNLVAPIPSFRVRSIPLSNGNGVLVVQVPQGFETPYLFRPKGSILIRTPTSSEPIQVTDREKLDRLYRQGAGGKRWAESIGEEEIRSYTPIYSGCRIHVIPEIEHGLSLESQIFKRSFIDSLEESFQRYNFNEGWIAISRNAERAFAFSRLTLSFLDAQAATLVVRTDGWITLRLPGEGNHESRIPAVLTWLAEVLERFLGHRGGIRLVVLDSWHEEGQGKRRVKVQRRSSVVDLQLTQTHEAVRRDINRSLGYAAYEPD